MNRLREKHVLITGASEGLGRQLALDFAREGSARLVLVARRVAELNKVQQEIQQLAPDTRVSVIQADLSQLQEIERIVASSLHALNGRLDLLLNNASTLGPTPMPLLVDYPLTDFQNVLATNLLSPFLLIQKLLPALINAQGRIINVTSDAGITGYAGWGAYGISKFGLEGLSQTWAAELEESGVRVNWIDPGSMNTKMHRLAEPEEDPSQWANPQDVTEIFIRLAADSSSRDHGKRYRAQELESEAAA